MNFQRARTENQIASRQAEIVQACDVLYSKKGYEDVTLKAISEATSISRPTIYNYYKTKEEILLDLLKIEYLSWYKALKLHFEKTASMTNEEYCRFLCDSLADREKFLKLQSVHYISIEKNCSLEKLIQFKKEIHPLLQLLQESIIKYFPSVSDRDNDNFRFLFFALIQGTYSLTHLTISQCEAMQTIFPGYIVPEFNEKFYEGLLLLTANF